MRDAVEVDDVKMEKLECTKAGEVVMTSTGMATVDTVSALKRFQDRH